MQGRRLFGGLALALLAQSGWAQTASQITPENFRPMLAPATGGIVIPASEGLQTPKGAEKLHVRLKGVQIEGDLPALKAASSAITASLAGHTVTAATIFKAAHDLEVNYARAGYVLVRVILPAQTLNNGAILRLVVVDGFIDQIDAKAVPQRVRSRVLAVLAPLQGRRSLQMSSIERQLTLASRVPGLVLRSTLLHGKVPGATTLVVDGLYHPVNMTMSTDNTMSAALGRVNSTLGFSFNSVAGLGEQVYGQIGGHPDGNMAGNDPRNRQLALGVILPLGTDGLDFNLEAATTAATPLPVPGGLTYASRFQRLSLRLDYPWIVTRNLTLSSQWALDAQDESLSSLAPVAAPLSQDRLRIFRTNVSLNYLNSINGQFYGRLTASQGVNGLGARTVADATPLLPLSRLGARADFHKLDVVASYQQPLMAHLAVHVQARAQTAFGEALPVSEQIGIADGAALSSFDAGSLTGDDGAALRGELVSPWIWDASAAHFGVIAAPYVFGALGTLHLAQPTALERANVNVGAFGLGLRLNGGPAAPNPLQSALEIEYGRQARNDGQRAENRLTIAGHLSF
ncbi:MAG: ShlB/FhaC/HecB family hemolysin secretion/activation protein [Hyphomicrobiales bacterium]|nr:ShlB/FhaC/HecB family hemolysin secretion/activation protein [Hyphomicrobiales bacterium]